MAKKLALSLINIETGATAARHPQKIKEKLKD